MAEFFKTIIKLVMKFGIIWIADWSNAGRFVGNRRMRAAGRVVTSHDSIESLFSKLEMTQAH